MKKIFIRSVGSTRTARGLLVLTDDKRLNFELLDPRFRHKRTYFAQVEGAPTEAELAVFKTGISLKIDGKPFKCAPAEAHILEKTPDFPERNPPVRFRAAIPTTWVSVTLTEGKNRQVRRMCAAAGFPVLRLVRVAIEELVLGDLGVGERRAFFGNGDPWPVAAEKDLFEKLTFGTCFAPKFK